jgi:hypothetical protein
LIQPEEAIAIWKEETVPDTAIPGKPIVVGDGFTVELDLAGQVREKDLSSNL